MRVVVIGPGALGCFFAGRLSKHTEVWLLDYRPERVERILSQKGIHCRDGDEQWQAELPVTANTEDVGTADLVIICTKSYHTLEALGHVQSAISDHTRVLSLQNGIRNYEMIANVVGKERTLAGITHHAVTLRDDGRIVHNGQGETVIGMFDARDISAHQDICDVFEAAGIETRFSRDIVGLLWGKLVVNAGINALSAVTRLTNGRLLEFDGTADLMRSAVEEAAAVARKKRIALPEKDMVRLTQDVCRESFHNRSSMLQDVLDQQRTEIDDINGAVVHEARQLKIDVPVNAALYGLIKTMEQSYGLREKPGKIQEKD
ncbi:MAG: ketopantoate reductase family protein [Candidatus Omnitrophota bacterium]